MKQSMCQITQFLFIYFWLKNSQIHLCIYLFIDKHNTACILCSIEQTHYFVNVKYDLCNLCKEYRLAMKWSINMAIKQADRAEQQNIPWIKHRFYDKQSNILEQIYLYITSSYYTIYIIFLHTYRITIPPRCKLHQRNVTSERNYIYL